MADKRISQLIERVDIANNDVLPIVASGASTTNKVTISTIQDWMQSNLDVGVTSVGITIGTSGNDVNVTGSPITTSGNITINIPTATATIRGLLSPTDFSTFNNKLSSVGLSMPSAFVVSNSPLTANGTIAVTGAGTVSQYIRGDGSLADFPETGGGGSSVSYYLNGSVSQGTIGGIAYYEINKTPILGAGTDFVAIADGYLASFITDAGDPALLEIPGGNWNFETYFSASSGGGTPSFYIELYKVSGSTATLIASNSATPELIAFGTTITPYFSTLAVPQTTLALTDRLALRYYVARSGRTITLHTENSHLCQIITTFTTGLTALNGLTAQVQNFATGTSGTDFNISSTGSTHTFNLPDASASNRGAVTTGTQTFAGYKIFNGTIGVNNDLQLATVGTALNTFIKNINSTGLTSIGSNGFGFNNANNIYFSGSSKGGGVFAFSNSGTQTYTLQDASGTLAFTSQIPANIVTGTGGQGRIAYWDSTGVIKSDPVFQYNDFSKRVGIGRTPLVSLDVEGAGAFSTSVTATNHFSTGGSTFATSSGQVGIGTSSYAGDELLMVSMNGTTNTQAINVKDRNAAASSSTYMVFRKSDDTFQGNIRRAGTDNALYVGGNEYISLGTGGNTERVRITSTGNVGIGTSSPLQTASGRVVTTINGEAGGSAILNLATAGTLRTFLYADSGNTILEGQAAVSINAAGSNVITLKTADTTRLTIASTGAATFSSSVTTLGSVDITGEGNTLTLRKSTNVPALTFIGASSNTIIEGGNTFNLYTGGAGNRIFVTSTGNVGIGVTPSAWSGIVRGFQVGQGASFSANTATTDAYMTSNCYYDGSTWRYIKSGEFALSYDVRGGTGDYVWQTAPSGTAGSAFTFTERMRITSGGAVIVGGVSSIVYSEKALIQYAGTGNQGFHINQTGSSAANDKILFSNSNGIVGYIRTDGLVTSYVSASDYRLKENIQPVEGALLKIAQLKPCNYNFINDPDKEVMGFIAHEVQEVMPQAVSGEKDAVRIQQVEVSPSELDEEGNVITEAVIEEKEVPVYQGIDHSKLVPLLVASIQELKAEIEALKSQING